MRILVAGGAGFLGSNLVERLLMEGHQITLLDLFTTGHESNIKHFSTHQNLQIMRRDVTESLDDIPPTDQIYHLACPASPTHYQDDPIHTLQTCFLGTQNLLELALRTGARLLFASTSEVYGDSTVCPQPETYFGNVNPYGPRACYDEGKRVGEALCYAYQTQNRLSVRIARIFNAYGPGMPASDGRVMSNFIHSAMNKRPLVITGDGASVRSFQYVDDCVEGLVRLMASDWDRPVNIGSEDMIRVDDLAKTILRIARDMRYEVIQKPVVFEDALEDDPTLRQPDCALARDVLGGWRPTIRLEDGIKKTIEWFQSIENHESTQPKREASIARVGTPEGK
jgi:UDP-glucuronate decarboxylase